MVETVMVVEETERWFPVSGWVRFFLFLSPSPVFLGSHALTQSTASSLHAQLDPVARRVCI